MKTDVLKGQIKNIITLPQFFQKMNRLIFKIFRLKVNRTKYKYGPPAICGEPLAPQAYFPNDNKRPSRSENAEVFWLGKNRIIKM